MAKEVSSSNDKDTGFVCFFLDISSFGCWFFLLLLLQVAVSIKAQEVHFKQGQSEDYVFAALVQVSYRYTALSLPLL